MLESNNTSQPASRPALADVDSTVNQTTFDLITAYKDLLGSRVCSSSRPLSVRRAVHVVFCEDRGLSASAAC